MNYSLTIVAPLLLVAGFLAALLPYWISPASQDLSQKQVKEESILLRCIIYH